MSMPQPLNFTTKAIEALSNVGHSGAPMSAQGFRYIADKLRKAQVFVLPDHGELLDRGKPRIEMDGLVLRPPFDVVALEYTAAAPRRADPFYTAARCSRRIALAWDWQDDLPKPFGAAAAYGPGVGIAAVAYYDDQQTWMPVMGAIHLPYEGGWQQSRPGPFAKAMIEAGQVHNSAKGWTGSPIPLLPEAIMGAASGLGSLAAALDIIVADSTDEVNAYVDLCYALACKNVGTVRHPAPDRLNRARIKAGKLPFADHHTLTMGGEDFGGASGALGSGSSPRSHLRRGHIRRLGPDRVTWVNQTMVTGRGGFVSKTYRMKGAAQ